MVFYYNHIDSFVILVCVKVHNHLKCNGLQFLIKDKTNTDHQSRLFQDSFTYQEELEDLKFGDENLINFLKLRYAKVGFQAKGCDLKDGTLDRTL